MRDYFLNATPRRQIGIAALAVMLLAGLIFLAWYNLLRTEYRPAFTALQSTDAATIVAELEKRKLPYKLADKGSVILVPADRADAIRLDIMSTELPLKGTVGFELFNKSDMGLTDFAQKINYQRALQGELARTILAMDGVDAVRVHLALGEDRIFRDDQVPPKASVVVRMKDGGVIPSAAADGMQRMIAAAVDKLEPANVVILNEGGSVVSVAPTPEVEPSGSPIVQEKRAIERYYEARILDAIEGAYPHSAVGVTVWADASTAASADGAGQLAKWSPEKRDFRLRVVLSPKKELAPGAMQDLRTAASSAIGLNPGNGDDISFGPAPVTARYPIPSAQNGRTESASPAPTASDIMPPESASWIPASLILLALAIIGAIVTIRARRPGMDAHRRAAFADRLSQLLREEEERGA